MSRALDRVTVKVRNRSYIEIGDLLSMDMETAFQQSEVLQGRWIVEHRDGQRCRVFSPHRRLGIIIDESLLSTLYMVLAGAIDPTARVELIPTRRLDDGSVLWWLRVGTVGLGMVESELLEFSKEFWIAYRSDRCGYDA